MNKENGFPVGLLMSADELDRIKANTRLSLFDDFISGLFDFGNGDADEGERSFLHDAFVYAITRERRFGDLALQGVRELLGEERWDYFVEGETVPIGFLMAGGRTLRMSLAFDWLYDLFDDAERAEIRRQIGEKGCVPIARALSKFGDPDISPSWNFSPEMRESRAPVDMRRWPVILGGNNFRMVMTGGLCLGTLTLAGFDERSEEWKDLVLRSLARCADIYMADGSYDEGVGYCNYATSHLIYAIEALRRSDGIDLADSVNFQGVVESALSLSMPHNLDEAGTASFGDNSRSMMSDIGFWVARETRDELAQYAALNHSRGHTIYSLIWYDDSVTPEPPTEPRSAVRNDLDWVVARSGYEKNDLVLAMRSGKPSNHEHADRNSIVMKYAGEVLLCDIQGAPYPHTDPGWFLRTSPAHNTVLVDGRGHQYHNGSEGTNASAAAAKIVRFGKRSGYAFWASDATQAYTLVDPDIASVTRSVVVLYDCAAIVVVDKLIKDGEPSVFSARWHAESSDAGGVCRTDGNRFFLIRPNAWFSGICAGSGSLSVAAKSHRVELTEETYRRITGRKARNNGDGRTGSLEKPPDEWMFPYAEVSSDSPAMESLVVTAGIGISGAFDTKTGGVASNGIDVERDSTGDFRIRITVDGKKTTVRVIDSGRLPELEVRIG